MFEPDADDSEIEDDSIESLVAAADSLSSKSVSSLVPYHVAYCWDSCHQQNVYYICMMCWWGPICLMGKTRSSRPQFFSKMVVKIHERKSHFQTNIAVSVHNTAPNYIYHVFYKLLCI